MNPKVWGPHAWIFLHSITLNYPDNPTEFQKKKYKEFFNSLAFVIPCEKCSFNYSKKIKTKPVNVDSKMDLVNWLLEIHNQVNKSNGKKEYTLNELLERFNNLYLHDKKLNDKKLNDKKVNEEYIKFNKKYINLMLLAFIIILIYKLLKK